MLEIKDLHVKFHSRSREAVAGVSLSIQNGEIVGLVGESGSGKSVTAMSVAGLLPRRQCDCSGEILLDGVELLHADRKKLRRIQGRDIGVVFQEPMSSLDPLMKIGTQVEEALCIHTTLSKEARRRKALEALEAVELPDPEDVYRRYPHELSGGMCQRAMIAAAITSRPKLLLLDEPTTALDVTIQAQILELLKKLNRESGISMLFISHNLAVVRKLCSRVAVMQKGLVVEEGEVNQIFYHPSHDYTKRLIAAIPVRSQPDPRLYLEEAAAQEETLPEEAAAEHMEEEIPAEEATAPETEDDAAGDISVDVPAETAQEAGSEESSDMGAIASEEESAVEMEGNLERASCGKEEESV